jgi:hypothetical protein
MKARRKRQRRKAPRCGGNAMDAVAANGRGLRTKKPSERIFPDGFLGLKSGFLGAADGFLRFAARHVVKTRNALILHELPHMWHVPHLKQRVF